MRAPAPGRKAIDIHRFWDGVITSSSNLTRLRRDTTNGVCNEKSWCTILFVVVLPAIGVIVETLTRHIPVIIYGRVEARDSRMRLFVMGP